MDFKNFFRGNPKNTGYSKQDLIDIVSQFIKDRGKDPIGKDITSLHKQGKSPSLNTFSRNGGLPYLIRRARMLDIPQAVTKGEARLIMRAWVKSFKQRNDGKLPKYSDFLKESPITGGALKKYYKSSFIYCLFCLGFRKTTLSKAAQKQLMPNKRKITK